MTSVFDRPRGPEESGTHEEKGKWLGPSGHTLISWEVDFRAGGAARLCVRSPEGTEQWLEGVHLEIVEPERVVFTGELGFAGGTITFRRA